MQKYIVRLDDACPTMDRKKWNRFFNILDKYYIKPIVAVIPNNEDKDMLIDEYDKNFWDKVREWQNKKYNIALHGFNHVYSSNASGLVPINKKWNKGDGILFNDHLVLHQRTSFLGERWLKDLAIKDYNLELQ